MFLLNRICRIIYTVCRIVFTSHYVPIKSFTYLSLCLSRHNLHPIMFLLNPNFCFSSFLASVFTSHYVPIKSDAVNIEVDKVKIFTSHYVPIKSSNFCFNSFLASVFTSHYVPIKSGIEDMRTESQNVIYIPLCSY